MGKQVSAFTNDAIGTLDAVGIAEAISEGKLSVSEVVEAAIKRAETVNPDLNAIVLTTFDRAREAAKHSKKGLLAGVPSFIKDNDPIKGLPTQMGTGAFKAPPAKRNSKFVDQYLSTGLIPLGKTTLPEFGLICSTENPKWGITRNPWNTDYTTGGSSSGSAAMVASGVVPIASANDGAGSTRIPASCCGLIGLKPSRNRLINFDGSEILPINIGYQGVLTRSVRDTAAFYAEAEKHYLNAHLPAMGYVQQPNKKRLKIAYFENAAVGKLGHQDADTQQTIQHSATLLQGMGHTVEQLKFPFDVDLLSEHFLNYYGFMAFAYKNLGGVLFKSKVATAELENFTTGLSAQFKSNFMKLSKSLKLLKKTGIQSEEFFTKYDLVMTPVLAQKVTPIGHFDINLPYTEIARRAVAFAPYTGLQNITGAPAIAIPMAKCSNGLPMGLQFIAPLGADKLLLEFAYEVEIAQPWKFLFDA